MLPKKNRIRDEKVIRRTIRNKQIHRASSLLEVFAEPSDENRLLVICNKKYGSAVRRNRMRRILEAEMRKKWCHNNKKSNIVVRVKGIIKTDGLLVEQIGQII